MQKQDAEALEFGDKHVWNGGPILRWHSLNPTDNCTLGFKFWICSQINSDIWKNRICWGWIWRTHLNLNIGNNSDIFLLEELQQKENEAHTQRKKNLLPQPLQRLPAASQACKRRIFCRTIGQQGKAGAQQRSYSWGGRHAKLCGSQPVKVVEASLWNLSGLKLQGFWRLKLNFHHFGPRFSNSVLWYELVTVYVGMYVGILPLPVTVANEGLAGSPITNERACNTFISPTFVSFPILGIVRQKLPASSLSMST